MLSQSNTKVKLSLLNLVFLVELIIVVLVITGILPRSIVLYWTAILAVYLLAIPLEDSTIFFIRSIPFFIAMPLTAYFDSLNMWRIFSGLIFLKWLFQKESLTKIWSGLSLAVKHHREFHKKYKITTLLLSLLFLSLLSAIWAPSHVLAVKRIIYFVNLSLIGIVIYNLVAKNQNFGQRLIKNIAIPTIIVAVVGILQQISTYYLDIFQFVDFWGGVVQRNLFGNAWADTALKANTWFAYFGNQLSLRMFSIFPDSHSFPIFLLLGLPAVLAVSLRRVIEKADGNFKTMLKTRASMLVVFVPLIFLDMILTGTRGIWAAGAMMGLLSIIFIFLFKPLLTTHYSLLTVFKYIASYLAIFFLLFGVAYYIIGSAQFMVEKDSTGLLAKRARSLIDISETSNARRIEIWKSSLRSIIKHPLLGVGIGNFPVVVGEDLARAKAGSSAHNLYLNIAAEMGLPALIVALWFLWLFMQKIYRNFVATKDSLGLIYFSAALLFIPWVLVYSLTDVAIFDERAFLFFVTTIGLIFGNKKEAE